MLHRAWVWVWVWVRLLLVFSPGSHGDSHEVDFQLICSHEPVVALAGEDVILPCRLEPPMGPGAGRVLWSKPGLDRKFILVYHQGRMIREQQNPAYENRTFLFEDQLKDGNMSLKLSGVQVSDGGRYLCTHEAAVRSASINLTVGAVSDPAITDASNASGHFLRCESSGWFPEPEVYWLREDSVFSLRPNKAVPRPDGLFDINSTVQVKEFGLYICGVHQRNINQTRAVDFVFAPELSTTALFIATVFLFIFVSVVTTQETYIFALRRYVGLRCILMLSSSLGVAVLASVVQLLQLRNLSEDVLLCVMVGFIVLLGITDLSLIFIALMKRCNICVVPYSSCLTRISALLFVIVAVLELFAQFTYNYYRTDYSQERHWRLLFLSSLVYFTLVFIITMLEETDLVVVSRRWRVILILIFIPILLILYLLIKLLRRCIGWKKAPKSAAQLTSSVLREIVEKRRETTEETTTRRRRGNEHMPMMSQA